VRACLPGSRLKASLSGMRSIRSRRQNSSRCVSKPRWRRWMARQPRKSRGRPGGCTPCELSLVLSGEALGPCPGLSVKDAEMEYDQHSGHYVLRRQTAAEPRSVVGRADASFTYEVYEEHDHEPSHATPLK